MRSQTSGSRTALKVCSPHGHSGWNKNAQHYSYRKHFYGRSYGFNTYGGPRYGSRGYYYGSPYNYYGSRPGLSITIR